MGLLPQRADEDDEIRPADAPRGQAGHLAERADDGEIPAGDEEVLLRPDEVQELPGPARDQVPDGSVGRASGSAGLQACPRPHSVSRRKPAQRQDRMVTMKTAVLAAIAALALPAAASAADGKPAPTFAKD